MQTEKIPALQTVIFTIVSILLVALWVSHAGDHIIVAKLTVEKLVWSIVIWFLCLYLVMLKPDQRADVLMKFVWLAVNWAIWMILVMYPLLIVIFLFVKEVSRLGFHQKMNAGVVRHEACLTTPTSAPALAPFCPGEQFMPPFSLRIGTVLNLQPTIPVVTVNAQLPLRHNSFQVVSANLCKHLLTLAFDVLRVQNALAAARLNQRC
jgi:hypothetical protein